jgi:uncharacterized protein (DUF111 family)
MEAYTRAEGEERTRQDAARYPDILVHAEAKVHGVEPEKVHFHELAHVDTLIDILMCNQGHLLF